MATSEASGLRREAGKTGLLFASLGGMIGSGWLFGALNAARIAGPASIISWVIGGLAVLLLAFVYAELTTMFPRPGAVIVFPKLCFGLLAAQVMSWINFLAYVVVAPAEAVAVVAYANNYLPGLYNAPQTSGAHAGLTLAGFALAAGLLIAFMAINLLAIRLVLTFNNAITLWKLIVPFLTAATLILVHFHTQNFTQSGFAPAGIGGIFAAVSGGGIIFTFLGFRQAIELAGESSDPKTAMPFAIIGSVLICILLYCALEAGFIGALAPADLAHGWAHLSFPGISGPFAGLASLLGLTWLAALLYVDAAISPGGTGVVYVTTAARVIFATADEGLASKRLAWVTRGGVPVAALALSFLLGVGFLMLGPVWVVLARYLTSIGILAYGVGPLVLICFRTTLPEAEFPRPFRLPYAQIFGPLAFIVANFVVFWAGADVANHLFGGLLIAFIIYTAWQFAAHRGLDHLAWRGAWWLAPYFTGLWLITACGPKSLSGGNGMLSGLPASALLVMFSLIIIALARSCAMPSPEEAKASYSRK